LVRRAVVLKFGGSATTNQTGLNPAYLTEFFSGIGVDLTKLFDKAVFVVGGGIRARKELSLKGPKAALAITRQHAGQLGQALRSFNFPVCLNVPTNFAELQMLVEKTDFGVAVGGLELGQTTDAVAMSAAQILDNLGYEVSIVVLSNVPAIYTADPKNNPDAKQVAVATLEQLVELGVLVDNPDAFRHGMNVPLDPIAVYRYKILDHHTLFFAGASDTMGVKNYLTRGEINTGTLIRRGNELCTR
jgi:uridylate kinase